MAACRTGQNAFYLRSRGPGLPPAPVQLLYPLSMTGCFDSLEHPSKWAALRRIRQDMIDNLFLSKVKDYWSVVSSRINTLTHPVLRLSTLALNDTAYSSYTLTPPLATNLDILCRLTPLSKERSWIGWCPRLRFRVALQKLGNYNKLLLNG